MPSLVSGGRRSGDRPRARLAARGRHRDRAGVRNGDTAAIRGRLGGGESLGLTLHYFEDRMPRGPAGCMRDAAVDSTAETFLVVEGTMLPQANIAELLGSHQDSGTALTVAAVNAGPPRKGCEPASDRLEPAGIYVFSRAALATCRPRVIRISRRRSSRHCMPPASMWPHT